MDSSETAISVGVLKALFEALPSIPAQHAPGTALYALLKEIARRDATAVFGEKGPGKAELGPFGVIEFPYHRMGAITSVELFGLDELIIFAFYWRNRRRYRKVADIGANIGLHSLLLSRCGYEVKSYEPDPEHRAVLTRNLERNAAKSVTLVNAAVSDTAGTSQFIRVLGNTTGSHLAGAKAAPYGDLQTITVEVQPFPPILAWADFVKIDAEGHEKAILLSTHARDWRGKEAIVEIGSEENAHVVFQRLDKDQVPMFAQKRGWERVKSVDDMPFSYRDGSLFIGGAGAGPWT